MKKLYDKITQNNNIAIYGNMRYCNDFKYVFQSVFDMSFNNIFYVQDPEHIICELQKICEQYQLVIACIDETVWSGIESAQLTNVVWMEDLFELLDEKNVGWFDKVNPSDEYHRIPDNKKVALWGLNKACDFFLQYQKNIVPECIFDRDLSKAGTYCGITVMPPDSIEDWNNYYVIIMCRDKYRVRDWLISKGMKESEDFIFYGYYIDRLCASEMMRKTVYAPSKRRIDCAYPFTCAALDLKGSLRLCTCANIVAGNILHQNVEVAWNSIASVIIRLSMLNQTYSFCDERDCLVYPLGKLPMLEGNIDERSYDRRAPETPEFIHMISSSVCNLYCETCRKERGNNSYIQNQRSMEIAKKAIPLIQKGNNVFIAGSGEVFLDASYQYILGRMKELHHEGLRWEILTNGNLMSKEKVDYILKYGGKDTAISVSVDAARKETYLEIRRGGNWERLIENLKYVGKKRKEGYLKLFQLNFVVQSRNVKEMGEFVQLAESVGANAAWFIAVRDWGIYGYDEFRQMDVRDEDGNIKSEYRKYFEDPILRSPIVTMDAFLTGKDVSFDYSWAGVQRKE